jgi:hypothetical protein
MKSEVRIKRTLKFGHGDAARIYLEGEIVRSPLPPELLREMSLKSGAVVWVEDDTPVDPRKGLAREIFKPDFGPRGDFVKPPVHPPVTAPKIAESKSTGVKVPTEAPKIKKPIVIKAQSEKAANEIGKGPEKPKVKLSLRK